MKVFKTILAIVFVFLGLMLFINGFGISITGNGIKFSNNKEFSIIEEETEGTRSEDGIYTVKGKIKQNSNDSYTGLMITLDLLNSDGKKVRETTGLMYSNYLGNNIWEFQVNGNDADGVVTGYRISYCYGY
ncbi:MAG: FxLYD domain-containing protein [Clostridia bacterium]|nr:FxLYD domain-containing protein [Clostridia bacterium]